MNRATRVALAAAFAAAVAAASTSSFWEMSSFTDFIAGKMEGVALSRDGRISAAPHLETVFDSGQPVIWSVVTGPGGVLYAATGHHGRIYRIDAAGKSSLLWTSDKPEVFALAVNPQGDLYAATSPNGKIYKIHPTTGEAQIAEYFDPKARYIWSLACAPDGTLYAGTGDAGVVYRITGAGQGEPYYQTGQGNVTGLMLDSSGRLLAGTEPNGILYRINSKDKAFALYDSTLPEVRALATGSDGSVYVAGLGGALAKKIEAAQQNQGLQQDAVPTISTTITVTAQGGQQEIKPTPQEAKPVQPAAAATPTPAATEAVGVEKSAIYRIHPDNTVDTLWSSKEENVYDILPQTNGDLYFSTDEDARIYRLTPNRRLTLVAQTNDGEAVRLLRERDTLLVATANAGKLYRLGAAAAGGTYESPVFDANATSRWGRFHWDGEGVKIETRSGNSLRPDNSWSDWSPALTDATGAPITSPNARYLQFRATLTTATAHLDNISAAYLPQNSPPVVHAITVTQQAPATPAAKAASSGSQSGSTAFSVTVTDSGDATAPAASTGTATQTMSRSAIQSLLISWTADDPDSDKLVFQLDFRGEGDDQWKALRRDLHDPYVILDGDALADGRYYFRVTASDRESNPEGSAREGELVSSPVLIDNTPPTIHVQSSTRNGATADVAFDAQDSASPLRRAEWSIDAGTWIPVAPVDGVLDSRSEQFRLHVTNVPAGEHLLVVRVADSGGNTGLAKVNLR
jgi:hypothetical protein